MIPIGDESPLKTTPVVTYSLIAVNVLVFVAMLIGGSAASRDALNQWGFTPARFSIDTLFTSMFLHSGAVHLIGNMLYLWIFGDNVEDVLGHGAYIAFYLLSGMVAGLGQYLAAPGSSIPLVGASGAISAVLGAYILLFAGTKIRVLLWFGFYFVRIVNIRAIWVLGFYFLLQVLYAMVAGAEAHVAYWAHIAGFLAGLLATAALLAAKVIVRPEWAMPLRETKAKPKPAFAGASLDGSIADYIEGSPGGAEKGLDRTLIVQRERGPQTPLPDADERMQIMLAALAGGNAPRAIREAQLEVRMSSARGGSVDTLVSAGDAFYRQKLYAVAVELYEAFLLRAAPDDERACEVRFRAGMIAAKYLREYDTALPLLQNAASAHSREDRVQTAQKEIARIANLLARISPQAEGSEAPGQCAIVRRTCGQVDVSHVGQIVAKATGKALADVTQMLRASVGVIATDIGSEKAWAVAGQLQQSGVPVLVIPTDKLVCLPAARRVQYAAASPSGIELSVAPGGGPSAKKEWSKIFYASAGLVAFDDLTPGAQAAQWGGWQMGTDALSPGLTPNREPVNQGWLSRRATPEAKAVLDIFTLDPFDCYRLTDDETHFVDSGAAAGAVRHTNLRRFIPDFLGYGGEVPSNGGVRILVFDVPSRRWKGLTFDSVTDFDRYNYWRLQLEQYG
jgi:membrane associated rhomboid family serine protease